MFYNKDIRIKNTSYKDHYEDVAYATLYLKA